MNTVEASIAAATAYAGIVIASYILLFLPAVNLLERWQINRRNERERQEAEAARRRIESLMNEGQ